MKHTLYLLGLAATLITLAGCRTGGEDISLSASASLPSDLDPRSIEQGEGIYRLHCADCHGASLEGEAEWKIQNVDGSFRSPPHDESGHTWHHSDAQLIDAIRYGGARLPADVGGISAMPAYDTILTETEIIAVLDFIKSSWPEEQRRYQWERTLQSQP